MENDTESGNVSEETSPPSYGFGCFTLRRIGQLLKIVFSERFTFILLLIIFIILGLEQYLIYNVGLIASGFFQVLGIKSWNGFWIQVLKSSLLILAMSFVLSCKTYLLNILYVSSRETLTDRLHTMYFSRNKFYILNTIKYGTTDNPDQRISQDVDKFCKKFSLLLCPFVVAPFAISYYSYKCYYVTGWIGPVTAFGVFILSVICNKLLMKPIINLVMKQEKFEGHFRYKHMHVRTNAESIAFQRANCAELYRSNYKLLDLIKTQQSLYLWQFPLNVAVNTFSYAGSIISYLILAYPIFSGKYENLSPPDLSQLISANAFITIYLISCFSQLINISTDISELGGLTHRVSGLFDSLTCEDLWEKDSADSSPVETTNNSYNSGDQSLAVIELRNVTYSQPRETKILMSNLTLQINLGTNLLIRGKSSSGKTSLFRIIRGLWPIQEGKIIRRLPFTPSALFVLPQHPLLSDGSLIEQIVYPLQPMNCLDPNDKRIEEIKSFLEYVELNHVLKKTDLFRNVEFNWYDVLSPGEAQRLSFVRLFYHRPKVAFLDEATSALGADMEAKLYGKCHELGITTVSIAHRSSLIPFHNSFLHLDGEGGWKITNEMKETTELTNL